MVGQKTDSSGVSVPQKQCNQVNKAGEARTLRGKPDNNQRKATQQIAESSTALAKLLKHSHSIPHCLKPA